MQSFQYTPLPENKPHIRLLNVFPGSRKDPVQCDLVAVELETQIQYAALSYTWGTDAASQLITINHEPYLVRPNLYAALLQLRTEQAAFHVWIDAVCINQDDVQERNAQVRLMHRIYSGAQGVLVWFGEEISEEKLDYELSPHPAFQPRDPEEANRLRAKWYSPVTRATYQLVNRPYWKRIWVVQEIAMAKAVVGFCGSQRVNWANVVRDLEDVRMTLEALGDFGKAVPSVVETVDNAFSIQQTRRMVLYDDEDRRPSLIKLLETNRFRDATDQRDKVFGLLNIATDGMDEIIQADYTLSVEQVFSRTAAHLMKKSNSFHILAHAFPQLRRPGLPSWAPDWSSAKSGDRFIGAMGAYKASHPSDNQFAASGETKASMHFSDDHTAMMFEAVVLTNAREIFQLDSNKFASTEYMKSMEELVVSYRKTISAPFNTTDTDTKNSFRRSLLTDEIRHIKEKPNTVERLDPQSWQLYNKWFERAQHAPHQPSLEEKIPNFYHEIWLVACRRSVFIMENGCVGLGPRELQPSDAILIPLGAKVPLAVRRISGEDAFEFVGECYVDGFMDGQVWQFLSSAHVQMVCLR